MIARPAFPASHGDAPSRPALWEGHAARGPILAALFPLMVVLGIFAALLLRFLLDPRPKYHRVGGRMGALEPLDPAMAGVLPLTMLFVLAAFMVVAMVRSRRAARERYRIDGGAVEMALDGVIDSIAIADIRRVAARPFLAWQRVRIFGPDRHHIDMTLGTRDAALLFAALRALGVRCAALDAVEPPVIGIALASGESVRWRGRPGLASFHASRGFAAIGILLPFAIFIGTLAWLWSSRPDPSFGLLLTLAILALFGWPSLAVLVTWFARLRVWFCDAFGAVVVTDRRVAWAAPFTGSFYRDVAFADLIEAGIIEQKGRGAWVTLTIRKGDDVRSEDLRGLPDADRFIAALRPGAR